MIFSMKWLSFSGFGWLADEAMVILCVGASLRIGASVSFLCFLQFRSRDL